MMTSAIVEKVRTFLGKRVDTKVAQKLLESLNIDPSNYFSDIEKARIEKMPKEYIPPQISFTEYSIYKPLQVPVEDQNPEIPFEALDIGTQFWAGSFAFRVHNDGPLHLCCTVSQPPR